MLSTGSVVAIDSISERGVDDGLTEEWDDAPNATSYTQM